VTHIILLYIFVELQALGFSEVLTLGLCSHNENFANFRTPEVDGTRAVVLDNPKTREFEVVRTSLLPGLMKTLRENKAMGHLRIFEVNIDNFYYQQHQKYYIYIYRLI
jgi:phenylalanyl-tRNA synthetase beta chain